MYSYTRTPSPQFLKPVNPATGGKPQTEVPEPSGLKLFPSFCSNPIACGFCPQGQFIVQSSCHNFCHFVSSQEAVESASFVAAFPERPQNSLVNNWPELLKNDFYFR